MADLFLERSFDPRVTADDVMAMGEGGQWCLEMYKVEWLQSLLEARGQSMLCPFRAPDAE